MDKDLKKSLQALGFTVGLLYLAARSSFDFMAGADSPFSRFINRPLYNSLTNGLVDTEKKYQRFLDEQRHRAANVGEYTGLATILTFPFSPDYDKYKDPSEISTKIYKLEIVLGEYNRKYGQLDSAYVYEEIKRQTAMLDSLKQRHDEVAKIRAQIDSLKLQVPFFNKARP